MIKPDMKQTKALKTRIFFLQNNYVSPHPFDVKKNQMSLNAILS